MSLDWLIIGGGIHGVHVAVRLLGEAGVPPERLRIVDPHKQLLSQWLTHTQTVGMKYLRSAGVHHLDLQSNSLREFAKTFEGSGPDLFTAPYNRPSLELFNAHCAHVMNTYRLEDLHINDQVQACAVNLASVDSTCSSGAVLSAEHLVLAIGTGGQPHWPDWAPRQHARVQHIFDTPYKGWPTSIETVAVVGGGISAVQTALRLVREGHCVHLVSRHELREHQFDSDPGWLGAKYMRSYCRVQDWGQRRAIINRSRHRGSIPPDVRSALRAAVANRELHWHKTGIESLTPRGDELLLHLTDKSTLDVQRVLLATGFSANRPGGRLVDRLIAEASLPLAECGYPVVDCHLRWHPRIYVTGPLAELELGPSSRNIAGARRAGQRVVESLK